jgi:hypothetical protein
LVNISVSISTSSFTSAKKLRSQVLLERSWKNYIYLETNPLSDVSRATYKKDSRKENLHL